MNTMTRILWISLAVLALGLFAFLWWASRHQSTQTPTPSGTISFPSGTGVAPISSASSTSASLSFIVGTQSGSLPVSDFLHNGVTVRDAANPTRYLLVGNSGACPSRPQECQAGPEVPYLITFDTASQVFAITLTQEPLSEARRQAETFLARTLRVSEQQLCSLKYLVGTTRDISEQYAYKNLGFSFCPGAVALPE